jgi:hypothetical protein
VPTVIDLGKFPDPRAPGGGGFFVLRQGVWMIKCGTGNNVQLFYVLPDTHPDEPHEPFQAPGTGLTRALPPNPNPPWPGWPQWPPLPPHPNWVLTEELIKNGQNGVAFCDGQNVVLIGTGNATIIQIFSS